MDAGLKHSPTAVDLYMLKARCFKHAGDHATAFHYMNEARRLDTQDRYLNTKCTRYACRAGKPKDAESIVALFLKVRPALCLPVVSCPVLSPSCPALS